MYGIQSLANPPRAAVRSPANPMDKCTVVSIFPKLIDEKKHTTQPSRYIIPPAPKNGFSSIVVGTASWWRDIDPEQPLLEITVSSLQVADSIVRDFCNGLFMCDMGDAMPGLFYVPGEVERKEVPVKCLKQMALAREKQSNWYKLLIREADKLWARTLGNPLAISDDMRLAALELELKDKPWMKDIQSYEMINCKFCGAVVKPGFAVCNSCGHVTDAKLYEELGGASMKVMK